jgi:hypothetical protein
MSTTPATTPVRVLARGILAGYAGISVEDYEESADRFLRSAQHPTLGRHYLACAYAPMVELLDYLTANGFSTYIASGGGRDFMRPISQDMYGVPRERVIGSSTTFEYTSDGQGGTITHKPEADYLDDGPEKLIRIGRRPCSRQETPTVTLRCSSSPSTPTSRPSGCSSSRTTQIGSSTTPRGLSERSDKPQQTGGRWSA